MMQYEIDEQLDEYEPNELCISTNTVIIRRCRPACHNHSCTIRRLKRNSVGDPAFVTDMEMSCGRVVHLSRFRGGTFQVPLSAASLGQYRRMTAMNGPFGAGSQFASRSLPGESC